SVKISLRELFRITPLGIVSMFAIGLVTATFFSLGPVYGQRMGLDVENISYFIASAVAGTIILQGPIGALSDRFDRRIVLTTATILTAAAAVGSALASQISTTMLFLSVGLFGGLAFPLYSVGIAYCNDHLDPSQMIAASGALVLTSGLGAVVGPVLVAMIMDSYGAQAFFWSMGVVHALISVYALYRMTRSRAVPLDKQGPNTPTAMHPSGSAIECIQQYTRDEAIEDSVDE
ncbi:MAG: MFS transporter, partial [Gammaproteobacteria bacterium]